MGFDIRDFVELPCIVDQPQKDDVKKKEAINLVLPKRFRFSCFSLAILSSSENYIALTTSDKHIEKFLYSYTYKH